MCHWQVGRKEHELGAHRTRIAELKQTWLQQLQNLVQKINGKFAHFFSSMGCAGEVDLHYPTEVQSNSL